MSIRAQMKTLYPAEIDFEMTISMSLGEWQSVAIAIKTASQSSAGAIAFADCIDRLVIKATETFTATETGVQTDG